MPRLLRTLGLFWQTSLAAEMEYRGNFFFAAVTSLFTVAGAVFTVAVLFQGDYAPGGYAWSEAVMVIGTFTVLDGVQRSLLMPNRMRITEMVREGLLDFVLLKPMDTQLMVSTRHVSAWGLPNLVWGMGLLVYAGVIHEPAVAWWQYLVGLPVIAAGLVTLYAVGFLLATMTIWFVKMDNITFAMQALVEAGRFPIGAYPGGWRLIFTFLIPVAFMTTVPAEAILGTAGPAWVVGSFAVAAALLFACRKYWSFALRHYTSASS